MLRRILEDFNMKPSDMVDEFDDEEIENEEDDALEEPSDD